LRNSIKSKFLDLTFINQLFSTTPSFLRLLNTSATTKIAPHFHYSNSHKTTIANNTNLQIKNPTIPNKMSAQNEGRQSPPPERSTGAQQQDTPSDGQGVNEGTNNKEESKSQLEVYLFL
jgi:hypothetical protein